MQNTKIAFDLGGVIIERGALENYLVIDSIVSVKLAVMKFGSENVYIMSKAKQKYIQRNIELLDKHQFFTQTGLKKENVYFVNQYEEKGLLGKQLGIDYLLDDSVKVAKIALNAGFKPILFGNNQQVQAEIPGLLMVKCWKSFRKLLEKIPQLK